MFIFLTVTLDQSETISTIWTTLALWLLNLILLGGGLCRLLLYGDPILSDNKVNLDIRRWKRQAEFNMSRQEHDQANRDLRKCLQYFGRSIPSTRTEIFFATAWQMLRQMLHKLYIGRWITWLGRRFAEKTEQEQMMNSAMEMATVYNLLLSLKLCEGATNGTLFLALSAVNYAEAASQSISKGILAEIYVNAALCFKQSHIPFWPKHYLQKARSLLATVAVPPKFKWIMTDDGFKFLISEKWSYGEQALASDEFTSQNSMGEPLAYAARAYRSYRIGQNLRLLTGTTGDPHMPTVKEIAKKIMSCAETSVCFFGDDKLAVSSESVI